MAGRSPSQIDDGPQPGSPARAGRGACRLILASGSPRRRALLAGAGLRFEVVPADIPEHPIPGEGPRNFVERLACEKAEWVVRRLAPGEDRVVVGSDTVVVLDTEILGKPSSPEHAVSMLRRLAGRAHDVVTGVSVIASETRVRRVRSVASRVWMRPAEEEELRSYVAGGEPLDKAGSYALQGEGGRFVVRVEGSRSNVIGLPLDETLELLRDAGVEPEG